MTGRADRQDDRLAPIQSVQRAAAILDLFSPSRPSWTLAEVTEVLEASRATAHRYLVALRNAGLLRYDEVAGIYTLGPQVLRLGAAALAGLPIVEVSGPFMHELAQSTGETVVLSVWDGSAPVIVRVEHVVDRTVHIHIRTGSRLSAETSAQGQVFLAHLEPEGGSHDAEADHLDSIRSAGLAMSTDVEPGIRAVAAPVFGGDGIAAVVAIVATAASLPEDRHSYQANALVDTAKQISEAIGSQRDHTE